jgi:hypothetical protein
VDGAAGGPVEGLLKGCVGLEARKILEVVQEAALLN